MRWDSTREEAPSSARLVQMISRMFGGTDASRKPVARAPNGASPTPRFADSVILVAGSYAGD
jgi:hypothetical protein